MLSHRPSKAQKNLETSHAPLSIVFFVPRGEVWSLRLSTWQWKALSVVLSVAMLWSLLSIFYLLMLKGELQNTEQNLRHSQKVIFEYQSQHSGVYEQVYPELHADLRPQVISDSLPAAASEALHQEPSAAMPPLHESTQPEPTQQQ